jgi:hypothetical protein
MRYSNRASLIDPHGYFRQWIVRDERAIIATVGVLMFRKTRITRFANAAMALWCGIAQLAAAQNTPATADASKSVTPVPLSADLGTKSTDSNMPSTAVKNVLDLQQPPISCKVGAKGVLTDCRISVGYNLNDVANWFQDDHDRTLQLAVDSLALAKRLERSSESCGDDKAKK